MTSTRTFGWTQFFRDAGLAVPLAKRYALMFEDNRISQDMLLDLNKEILSEIGVTAMGDVINILKHAKKVHTQDQKKKERDSLISSTAASTSSKRISMASPHSTTTSHRMPVVSTTSTISSTRKKAVKRVKKDSNNGDDMEVAYIAYVEPAEKDVLLEQRPVSRKSRAYRASDLDQADNDNNFQDYLEPVSTDVSESYVTSRYDSGVKKVRGRMYSDDVVAEETRASNQRQQAGVIMLPGEGRDIFTTKALQKAAKVYESGTVQEGVLNSEKSRRLLESAGLIPADVDPEPSSVFSRLDYKSPSTTRQAISYATSPPGAMAVPQESHRRIIQLSKSPSTKSGLYSDRSMDTKPSAKKRVIAIQSTSDSTTSSPPRRKIVSHQASKSRTLYSDSINDNSVSSSVQAVKKRFISTSQKSQPISSGSARYGRLKDPPAMEPYTVTVQGKMASDAPSQTLSMRLGLANKEKSRTTSQGSFSRMPLARGGKARPSSSASSMPKYPLNMTTLLSPPKMKPSQKRQRPVVVSALPKKSGVFGYEDSDSELDFVRPPARENTFDHSTTMVADEYEYQSLRQKDIRSRLEVREREKAARRGGPLAGRLGTHEVFMRLE